MEQPIAYLNGQFIPEDQLHVVPQDLGFMWGVTVAEQLRTFHGELFLLEEHLQRLAGGLAAVGVDVSPHRLATAAKGVVAQNYPLIKSGSDLGLTIFVTPGLSPTYSSNSEPTIGMHTYQLPFRLWWQKYEAGQVCDWSEVRQVPTSCWPSSVKARSRLHYYLADRDARSRRPGSRAILLDQNGYVNEASTANVVAFFAEEGFVSPPLDEILPGVSLRFVEKLAKEIGQAFTYRRIAREELEAADEVLLTSTPFCLLPVSRIGDCDFPHRAQYALVMQRWCQSVGVDIPVQAVVYHEQ